MIDTELYMSGRLNQPLTLALLQPLAQNRWTWIVTNWTTLSKRFTLFANGNGPLLATLKDFDRMVASYLLGNLQNPFDHFANLVEFFAFLNIIKLSELRLSPAESILVNQETDRVSQFEIADFRRMLAFIRTQNAQVDQIIGLGDPDATKLLGNRVVARQRNATLNDLVQLDQANDIYDFIEGIVIDLQRTRSKPPDLIRSANNNLAPGSDVRFNDSFRSYIPVPFEITLEHMAQKYLGNRNLWFELLSVNNLQPPYIDESGQKLPLLAPAAVNNLIIADTDLENVPVGTKVGVGSLRYREETRIVQRVINTNNGSIILFLSGSQDLNRFAPADKAFVRIYAPNTTRNGQFVLIPLQRKSNIPTNVPTPTTDALRQLGQVLLSFGVDVARDEKTNDWIVDPNGNFKYAAGLDNVRQSVLFAMRTQRGELPFHPTFGVNINIGDRFFGTTDEALVFGQVIRDTLLKDARLTSVTIQSLQVTGTSVSLSMLVVLQGFNQPIPLSFVA